MRTRFHGAESRQVLIKLQQQQQQHDDDAL